MSLDNYRRRIDAVISSKVSREKEKKSWRCIAERKTNYSFEYAYHVPNGYSIVDIEKQIDALSATCGAFVELQNLAGVVIVKVFHTNFPKLIKLLPEMLKKDSVLLGFERSMNPVYHSFKTNPHLLIGGMSGYGKTDLLRLIIYQLLQTPNIEIIIVDMKGFSFLPFDVPQIKHIARDLTSAYQVLNYAVREMLHREQMVWENRNRSVIETFHPIVVVIDEAAQIAPKLQKDKYMKKLAEACDECCAKIATKGREPKVSLIYTTQRPDHEVINGQVKANMDCAISMRTKTISNSMIILDRPGAEQLPHKVPGRAIYSSTTDSTIQIPYVGNDDAWQGLLVTLKTEVLDYGKSERRKKEPNFVDVSDDPTGDNRADCKTYISGKRIASETFVGNAEGAGAGKDSRGKAPWNHEKSMAALPQGKTFARRNNDTDTVEYDET